MPQAGFACATSGYSAKHKVPWTKVAESYPVKLCNALAVFLVNDLLPPQRRRKLDIAARAKCNARIGEAQKPGPRPRRSRPAFDLEQVQMLTSQTVFIQQRVRTIFAAWLESELSPETWSVFSGRPELCTVFLRAFGRHLFDVQQPMYLFRHLVVFYQRNYPTFPGPQPVSVGQ